MASELRDMFRNLVVPAWIGYISTLNDMWDITDELDAVRAIMQEAFPAFPEIPDTRHMVYRFVGVFL